MASGCDVGSSFEKSLTCPPGLLPLPDHGAISLLRCGVVKLGISKVPGDLVQSSVTAGTAGAGCRRPAAGPESPAETPGGW